MNPQNRDVPQNSFRSGTDISILIATKCPASREFCRTSLFCDGTIPGMRVFGLTGNIGSGKSTVAAMLREAGIPVLDADRISKEVTAPGGRAYDAVVQAFGRGIVRDDGSIDRKRLGEIVFSDPASRERLERITHPAILEAMKEAIAGIEREGHRAAVVEATLIHESGRKGLFEAVISVTCDRETAISRLAARDGMSRRQAEARLRAQMDADRKAGRFRLRDRQLGGHRVDPPPGRLRWQGRCWETGLPDRFPRWEERFPERLRHPLAGDVPSVGVEPREKAFVRSQRAGNTMPRERQKVWQRGGDEPLRGGARHGGGHVRHAVVDDTLFDEIGGRVCRRAGRFDRPPLVDGDIHHHRPGPHRRGSSPGKRGAAPAPPPPARWKRRRSASRTASFTASGVDRIVRTFPPHSRFASASFSGFTSRIVTFAPIRAAIRAALRPATPAPSTVTSPGGDPSVPGSSTPRPPHPFSSPRAPTWMERIPATSLIGRRIGSAPPDVTVS